MNSERENQPLRSPPHNLTLLPSQFTRMSQETVRFSSSAWRAVGATIASQGSQGQASPVQEEAPAAPLTPAVVRLGHSAGLSAPSVVSKGLVSVQFVRISFCFLFFSFLFLFSLVLLLG